MTDANAFVQEYVESLDYRYVHDAHFKHILHSGLLFTSKKPISISLPSTPFATKCIAPLFFRNRLSKRCCGKKISDIGPYCDEHSILYHNLQVKASNIDCQMRGLFACASTLNTVEIRRFGYISDTLDNLWLRLLTKTEYTNYTNRERPIFEKGDIISPFGGMLSVGGDKKIAIENELAKKNTHSYIIEYSDDSNACILMDGFIESSGIARFANSVIESAHGRILGKEYHNADMVCINIEKTPVSIGAHFVSKIPGLMARKQIFHGDEIITNYGAQYWTCDFINSLPSEKADYLNAKSDQKPDFFQKK